MQRLEIAPRPHWQQALTQMGLTWYAPTPEHPVPYWCEEAYYRFEASEIQSIERAAQQLTQLVLEATDYAITAGRLAELGIPAYLHAAISESWQRDDPTLYMRLDLAYTNEGQLALLEVNGQTPTSLIEAALCQWQWLEDRQQTGELGPDLSQWNTIHEGLLEQWQHLVTARQVSQVTFSAGRNEEDIATITYLRDLAQTAGAQTSFLLVDEVGTSSQQPYLLDGFTLPIHNLMWLWPFEYAWESRDAAFLSHTQTRFIEPLWKAVSSSKGLLALLHEMYPKHPHILPATLHLGSLGSQVVSKPLYSREGQNVALPHTAPTQGQYADLPTVEQAYIELPTFAAADGPRYPVLGVWVAGDEVCGLGIREGRHRVTDNHATFIPHLVRPSLR